jgi:hypothetical protein
MLRLCYLCVSEKRTKSDFLLDLRPKQLINQKMELIIVSNKHSQSTQLKHFYFFRLFNLRTRLEKDMTIKNAKNFKSIICIISIFNSSKVNAVLYSQIKQTSSISY